MTPLRQRMVDDMKIRNFSGTTLHSYIQCVARYAQHFGRSPGELDLEHVRADKRFERPFQSPCQVAPRRLK